MLLVDSLVVIGLATASTGSIHETDGAVERSFWLLNSGCDSVAIVRGYTSCGCTTLEFPKNTPIAPGDSAQAVLRFNPRGRSGDFYQSGTMEYGTAPMKRIEIALEGTCIPSEETLRQQFPIVAGEGLRLSANRFDLGTMRVGETKQRGVMVLQHCRRKPQGAHTPVVHHY